MTDEKDKSDHDKTHAELIDTLAKLLAGVVTRVVIPEVFVVYEDDMRLVMLAYSRAKDMKEKDRRTQALIDAVEHMWRECKPLTSDDMEIVMHGLDLASAETEAKKEKETVEPEMPKPNDE